MERKEKDGSTAIITDKAGMPSNKNAEAAVLGAMLWDNSIIPDVGVTLPEPAFHDRKNRTAYNAIRDAWENDGVADQVTVTMHLLDAGKLDDIGQPYVAELAGETATSANWKAHARIVTDHQNRRNMIVLAQKCDTLARAGDNENTDPTLGEVNGHIETAEGIINALLSNAGYTGPVETTATESFALCKH